ncbi:MAG: hypothetical protein M3R53_01930 [Candidatus Eremiobacteraeota bacterium]|nr:hypothetical protein [Candidatus Eremiobacteraeota bacterium]
MLICVSTPGRTTRSSVERTDCDRGGGRGSVGVAEAGAAVTSAPKETMLAISDA